MALTCFCSVLGGAGQAFFKAGAENLSMRPLALLTNVPLLVGLACYAAATALFVFALKHGNLSSLYPLIALSYVWVFLISWIYFKEFQDRSIGLNLVGVGLILVGVILVAMGR